MEWYKIKLKKKTVEKSLASPPLKNARIDRWSILTALAKDVILGLFGQNITLFYSIEGISTKITFIYIKKYMKIYKPRMNFIPYLPCFKNCLIISAIQTHVGKNKTSVIFVT